MKRMILFLEWSDTIASNAIMQYRTTAWSPELKLEYSY